MEFSLHPKDIGLSVKLSVEGSVFTEYQVSCKYMTIIKVLKIMFLEGLCQHKSSD